MRLLVFVVLLAPALASGAEVLPELRLTLPAAEPPPSTDQDMNFDLLGAPKPTEPTPEEIKLQKSLKLRREMLTAHQSLGIGLLAFTVATCVVGQLNYSDRFAGPSTGRYELTHTVVSFTTFGVFVGTGTVALLAPVPTKKENQGIDRVTLHKIGMFTATAGMATQAVLGIVTTSREGYLNQKGFATAHLVVGYATLAAMLFGVGALVF